jgi:hypothetical protein
MAFNATLSNISIIPWRLEMKFRNISTNCMTKKFVTRKNDEREEI